MSIASKHAYRFGYLKSDKWEGVRYAVLARHKCKCFICRVEDFHNDVHHVKYPKNIWETEPSHCVPLCRKCHDAVHVLIKGRYGWSNFMKVCKVLAPEGVDLEVETPIKPEPKPKYYPPPQCNICKTIEGISLQWVLMEGGFGNVRWNFCDRCWNDYISLCTDRTKWKFVRPYMDMVKNRFDKSSNMSETENMAAVLGTGKIRGAESATALETRSVV